LNEYEADLRPYVNFIGMSRNAYRLANEYTTNFWLLLLISGICGSIFGLLTATWQHPVETAQVLMGLVTYDPSSLAYAYHVKLFSLLNYVAWFFLAITNSEIVSSILLSAMIGTVAMQMLVMIIFLVVRNIYVALLITLFLTGLNFFGSGIAYPVLFMGTEHSYGRSGIIFVLYSILFLSFSKYKIGFFLTGLTLGVHPAWGIWLNFCLIISLLISYKKLKLIFNATNIICYLIGLFLILTVFIWQRMHYPVTFSDSPINITEAKEIALNYVRYWDHHRQKFDNVALLFNGIFFSLTSALLSFYYFRVDSEETLNSSRIFYIFICVSTVLAIPLIFIPSWFDPIFFPERLVALMPGRFINISIFVCTPLLFSTIYIYKKSSNSIFIFILILTTVFIVGMSKYKLAPSLALVLIIALFLLINKSHFSQLISKLEKSVVFNLSVIVSIFIIVFISIFFVKKKLLTIRTNFDLVELSEIGNRSILTTMERYLIQAETRVSSITPHIDGYIYSGTPSTMIDLNRFSSDIFGISLLDKPKKNMHLHSSIFHTRDYQDLWERRSCQEWESLSRKYNFDLILVPSTMRLNLFKIDNDPRWNKYKPSCIDD
jgi:hypothetical protein